MRLLNVSVRCLAGFVFLGFASVVAASLLPPVPGLKVHLDASDPSGTGALPANGTQLATWVDLAGGDHDAIQTNSLLAPTFVSSNAVLNGIAGKPAMYFDGGYSSSDPNKRFNYVLSDFTHASAATGFIVFRAAGGASSGGGHNGGAWGLGGTSVTNHFPTSSGGIIYDNFGINARPATVTGAAVFHTWYIYSVALEADGSWTAFLDGTEKNSGTATINWASTTGSIKPTIGASANATGRTFNGYIAEVLFFDSALNWTDSNAIGYYLENKYGLNTSYLPTPEPSALLLLIAAGTTLLARRPARRASRLPRSRCA